MILWMISRIRKQVLNDVKEDSRDASRNFPKDSSNNTPKNSFNNFSTDSSENFYMESFRDSLKKNPLVFFSEIALEHPSRKTRFLKQVLLRKLWNICCGFLRNFYNETTRKASAEIPSRIPRGNSKGVPNDTLGTHLNIRMYLWYGISKDFIRVPPSFFESYCRIDFGYSQSRSFRFHTKVSPGIASKNSS